MSKPIDLTGKKFDQLLVLGSKGRIKCGNQNVGLWEVRCDCGKVLTVRRSNLIRKHGAKTKSCGCLKGLYVRTHGLCAKREGKYYRAPEYLLWLSASHRAKISGTPFTIKPEDIIIPEYCPIFGTKLVRSVGKGANANSPSLDRIVTEFGYVKDNIAVISYRANSIKQNATAEELQMVVDWLKRKTNDTRSK